MQLVRLDSVDEALLVVDASAGVDVSEVLTEELVECRRVFADEGSDAGLFDGENFFARVHGEEGDGDEESDEQEREIFHGGLFMEQTL